MRLKKSAKRRTREEHEKKKTQPKKSMRGQCETEYGELKKTASYSLTPTSIQGLKALSKELNISASDLIEKIGRGDIKIIYEP